MTEAMAPPSTKAPYALDDHYAHYAPEGWEQPYFLPPPAVEEPAHTAQGPKPKKRWNPILGAYVTQVGRAEEELRAEERQHNLDSYRYAMGKVIKREGNFDPVFWRHRMTGEHAGHPALTGRKRLGKDAHAVADALRVDCGAPSPVKVEPMWNERQVDHVRQLLNHDALRAEPGRNYPTARYKQVDHVRSLIHHEPPAEDDERVGHHMGKKALHQRKGSKDVCVANLLDEERARRLPDSSPHKSRSVLGEVMRSGAGLRLVLNPGLAGSMDDNYEAYKLSQARSNPESPARQPPANYRSPARTAPYGTAYTPGSSASPTRPPRPEWLDHDGHASRGSVSAPPRPSWLTHDPPAPASPSKPYSRPAYMDYSAVMSELVPREHKMRR